MVHIFSALSRIPKGLELMNQDTYINSSPVNAFLQWMEQRMDTPGSFRHAYLLKKQHKPWSCDSLFDAYQEYYWPYIVHDQKTEKKIHRSSFGETMEDLFSLSQVLKASLHDLDQSACKDCCLEILRWGGVLNYNRQKIEGFGDELCQYLIFVQKWLREDKELEHYHHPDILMNAGFTKIYALLVEDFIIYDGRVGAAVGSLVRRFCEEKQLETVPAELKFAWGQGRVTAGGSSVDRRNPSRGKYVFPAFSGNRKRHLESNLMANWLLGEMVRRTGSRFKLLEEDRRLWALQSALFMIGYDVSSNE